MSEASIKKLAALSSTRRTRLETRRPPTYIQDGPKAGTIAAEEKRETRKEK
jgi:hypothetical protein